MKRKVIIFVVAFVSIIGVSEAALACACCSFENTFSVKRVPAAAEWRSGLPFAGNLGIEIYGEAGDPGLSVCTSDIRGSIVNDNIAFDLSRAGKSIGRLVINPVGEIEKSAIGMDILLPGAIFSGFKLNEYEPPIYHRWRMKAELHPDDKLIKQCAVQFKRSGWLTLHGYSNNCWDPFDDHYDARWTLEYDVSDGKQTVRALGKGIMGQEVR